MPTWECFKELCILHFEPTVRSTRLCELARLPFVSMVQDYSDHFQHGVVSFPQSVHPIEDGTLWAAY